MSLNPKKDAPRDPTLADIRAIEEITLHADSLRTSLMRHVKDADARKAVLEGLRQVLGAAHKGVMT